MALEALEQGLSLMKGVGQARIMGIAEASPSYGTEGSDDYGQDAHLYRSCRILDIRPCVAGAGPLSGFLRDLRGEQR